VDLDKINFGKNNEKPWAANGHGGRRKNNIINSLYLQPEDLEERIKERYNTTYKQLETEVRFEEIDAENAEIVIVSYGISARIAKRAYERLKKEGIKAGFFRPVTLNPFPSARLKQIAGTAGKFLVTELNMGQMTDDVKLAVECSKPVEFFGRTGGVLTTPEEIYRAAKNILNK
ncbi:MAG: 3-methyl-2-oxobutanoate dehydrogenase subunit beta, partial [Oscillospiraceae bacterium]|nr:3-methyl-2-oxobutanoate dehydrogenase subunit beta [Oscillospiraceae bacterium]